MHYRYVIVGGGLAAAAAVEGIRSRDAEGGILLLSRENHPPYRRAPLALELWERAQDLDQLTVHPEGYYDEHGVSLRLRRDVVELDAENRVLWDERGDRFEYDDVLIATGCRPRRLQALGAESSSVRYYRDLEDYLDLRSRLERVQHVSVVGAYFTAIEMTVALRSQGVEVTLVFPEEWPLYRRLPRDLGLLLVEHLRGLGVETVSGDALVRIEETGQFLHARTQGGYDLTTQLVLVDAGSEPQVELAEAAGLDIDDGIVVDSYGRGSRPGVWAAGDVAEFPYLALGQLMRVEGIDHAEHHGRVVGANMAGGETVYDHMPRKWFRAGALQFEGVGELNSRLETETFWIEPEREAVVFYVLDDVVRGVLFLNAPDRLEWARALVREARPMSRTDRAALVAPKV